MDHSNLLQTLGQVSSDQVSEVFRQHLRGAVLQMISDVMAEEVTSLGGPKHRPVACGYFRAGSSSGRVIYEGDREDVVRPRVRQWQERRQFMRSAAGDLPGSERFDPTQSVNRRSPGSRR